MFLRIVRDVVEVDDAIANGARVRAVLEPFEASARFESHWSLRSGTVVAGAPLIVDGAELAHLDVDGRVFTVQLGGHEHGALAALRAVWFASVVRQGGVLVHASAVRFGDKVVVAAGQSGSGKSTLARLCVESGLAGLLSDEMVALMPDGTCWGTPFHSDLKLPGSDGGQRTALALSLTKADEESLHPARAAEHAALYLSQCFQYEALKLLTVPEMMSRLTAALSGARLARLHFRKDVAVGAFLARELAG